MAKAKVGAAGIEYIQGAMKRPKKVNGHNHGNYLVMTHRTAETTNPNCQRIYTFDADRYNRSTPVRENEAIARELFTQRAAGEVFLCEEVLLVLRQVLEACSTALDPCGTLGEQLTGYRLVLTDRARTLHFLAQIQAVAVLAGGLRYAVGSE